MQRRHVLVVALVFFSVAACSSDSEPPVGSEGGHCYGNGTCNSSLICLSNLCVQPADAGTDAGADAGPVDAGVDAGPDAHVPGCVADTYFCDTPTGSAHCNSAGTGIDLSINCAATHGETCNPFSGECFVCVPYTTYCYSATVFSQCNSLGTGDDGSLDCMASYGTMCDPVAGRCADP
jgi:hypothetical protein